MLKRTRSARPRAPLLPALRTLFVTFYRRRQRSRRRRRARRSRRSRRPYSRHTKVGRDGRAWHWRLLYVAATAAPQAATPTPPPVDGPPGLEFPLQPSPFWVWMRTLQLNPVSLAASMDTDSASEEAPFEDPFLLRPPIVPVDDRPAPTHPKRPRRLIASPPARSA